MLVIAKEKAASGEAAFFKDRAILVRKTRGKRFEDGDYIFNA